MLAASISCPTAALAAPSAKDVIQPYAANPRYWQHRGRPVLLVGGFVDDNPFQIERIEPLLDELAQAGGNYIRNTMSDRKTLGHEVYPFLRVGKKYDLERWNPVYWRRFDNFLSQAQKRGIVVQIEVWDRFDHSRAEWQDSPYNPRNNRNYSHEQTGFAREYPNHPSKDVQPFFHTIPGMSKYDPRYDVIRRHQERFVDRMLSSTVKHDNVLFCINNETTTDKAWGQHWLGLIRTRYQQAGLPVYATDMFDDGHHPEGSRAYAEAIADPEMYPFLDISQVNSRNFDEEHWNRLRWYVEKTRAFPRPLNHTKIYGGGYTGFGSGGLDDGVERFWRNLLAGSASARFHRPSSGNGLNDHAKGSLKAVRAIERHVSFWELEPVMQRLSQRESDEAYVAANPGRAYVVYFTRGGAVTLDLRDHAGALAAHWINLHSGEAQPPQSTTGGKRVELVAPAVGPWAVVLTASARP